MRFSFLFGLAMAQLYWNATSDCENFYLNIQADITEKCRYSIFKGDVKELTTIYARIPNKAVDVCSADCSDILELTQTKIQQSNCGLGNVLPQIEATAINVVEYYHVATNAACVSLQSGNGICGAWAVKNFRPLLQQQFGWGSLIKDLMQSEYLCYDCSQAMIKELVKMTTLSPSQTSNLKALAVEAEGKCGSNLKTASDDELVGSNTDDVGSSSNNSTDVTSTSSREISMKFSLGILYFMLTRLFY